MIRAPFNLTRLAFAVFACSAFTAQAQTTAGAESEKALSPIEQTTIIGSKEQAAELAGSAYVVTNEDIEQFSYTDINNILRDVPGVYLRQEEGFGLRPNIGIRGAVGERNNKITVMEDGILIAPAPYSGPAAYYFPSAGRLYSVEVLKGPATIANGPFTVGGAINLLSTPIPEQTAGSMNIELGQYGEQRLHVWAGSRTEQTGFMLETYQQHADGFQSIDRYDDNTGLKKQDYLLKGRWNTANTTDIYQQFDIKLSYASEDSDQTYLGTTNADFKKDPDRRYGLTHLDNMDNEHKSLVLSHLVQFNDNISLTTSVYQNKFKRNWYKVDKINGDGISSVIDAVNNGSATAIQKGMLEGTKDGTVAIKHNDREYTSQGIQSALNWQFETGNISHDLKTGIRLHQDEVDRFQPSDTYNQIDGYLQFASSNNNNVSTSDNRLQEADALSLYALDTMSITDKLDITAGLRYENYDSKETRRDMNNGTEEQTASNDVDDILPALGFTYQVHNNLQLLAGYSKGFAPAEASATNTDPEKSDNYEMGGRFKTQNLNIDLIGFYSDYSNAVKNCSVNSPCSNGAVSGSESYGSSEVQGIEFLTQYDYGFESGLHLPISLSYTYTDAKIQETTDSATKGDILANIPENMFSASIGLADDKWDTYLKAAYSSGTCPDTTCNRSKTEETDDLLVFDWVASYFVRSDIRTYIRVENLADERAIVSRLPAGARANRPRTAYIGFSWDFL